MICLLASYGYSNLESSRSEPVSQTLVHRLCLWPVQKYNPSLCKKELNMHCALWTQLHDQQTSLQIKGRGGGQSMIFFSKPQTTLQTGVTVN